MEANLLHLTQFASMAPAQYLIASLWQGLLLTAVAWLALKALGYARIPIAPGARFVLWMVVFLLSAVVPLSALFQSHAVSGWHVPALNSSLNASGTPFAAAHLSAIWAVAIVGIWVAATLFSISRLLWNIHRLDVLTRTSFPVPPEAMSRDILSLLEGAGAGRKPVDLCLSDRIDSPMVIGFLRPVIVMPRWLWRKLSPSELSQIVMHELAHLRRGDDWTNLLQKLLRALFPLNPALLLAERQLCWEREMACDDAVLGAAISPKEYATCLTNLAENRLLRRVQSLAPSAWQRRSELSRRVHRVLAHKRALRPAHSGPIVAAFLAAFLCGGLMLTRSPRFVTFTMDQASSPAGDAELQSFDRDNTLRVLPARAFMPAKMGSEAAPHVVDATFHTLAPVARTQRIRLTSATLHAKTEKKGRKRNSLRSFQKQRPAPGFRQASLTSSGAARFRRPQMYMTEALFPETIQSIKSQPISNSTAPRPVLTQELVLGGSQPGPAQPNPSSGGAVVFYLSLSPSPYALPGGTPLPSRVTISQFNNGWIIIQL